MILTTNLNLLILTCIVVKLEIDKGTTICSWIEAVFYDWMTILSSTIFCPPFRAYAHGKHGEYIVMPDISGSTNVMQQTLCVSS